MYEQVNGHFPDLYFFGLIGCKSAFMIKENTPTPYVIYKLNQHFSFFIAY